MKKILFITALTAMMASCAPKEASIEVVPYPNSVQMKSGTFNAAGAMFQIDSAMDDYAKDAVKRFAEDLSLISGVESIITGDPSIRISDTRGSQRLYMTIFRH